MKIGVIVLAAGNSRRFGTNKLLYEIEDKPMYRRLLETAAKLNACMKDLDIAVTVVTQYEEIGESACSLGFDVQYNPCPEEGISSSLKLGLAANFDADACLFAVCDQPWLRTDTLKELIYTWQHSRKGIVCASAYGIPGNPCIFSSKYFPELLALTGDVGGRRVAKAHPEDVEVMEVGDGKELVDVDELPEKSGIM